MRGRAPAPSGGEDPRPRARAPGAPRRPPALSLSAPAPRSAALPPLASRGPPPGWGAEAEAATLSSVKMRSQATPSVGTPPGAVPRPAPPPGARASSPVRARGARRAGTRAHGARGRAHSPSPAVSPCPERGAEGADPGWEITSSPFSLVQRVSVFSRPSSGYPWPGRRGSLCLSSRRLFLRLALRLLLLLLRLYKSSGKGKNPGAGRGSLGERGADAQSQGCCY